jgi:hypothetical protein
VQIFKGTADDPVSPALFEMSLVSSTPAKHDVLNAYKALTKQKLVISPDVSRVTHGITLHTDVTSVEKRSA